MSAALIALLLPHASAASFGTAAPALPSADAALFVPMAAMGSPRTASAPLHGTDHLTARLADDDSVETQAAPGKRAARQPGERRVHFEVNLRGRRMTMPRGILDVWFTPTDDLPKSVSDRLGDLAERPFVNGWAYGVELAFRDRQASGIVYFDWVESRMEGGYFDDPDEEYDDGDLILPAPNLGIAMFGVNYAYDIPFVKTEKTKGIFGLGLTVGAGLGLGILVGQVERWEEADREPSYEKYLRGDPPNSEDSLPGFYPVVDFNIGLKMNFADRFHVRFEGGLHTMLYYGMAAGMSF